jgi:autotransporter strand-loop-strand O-heptosyltransferase
MIDPNVLVADIAGPSDVPAADETTVTSRGSTDTITFPGDIALDSTVTAAINLATTAMPEATALTTAAVAAPGAPPSTAKSVYPPPAELPTQTGPNGMRFDFNDGCRVVVPEAALPWRVRLHDLDTGNILFETRPDFGAGRVNSSKRYYVRFRIEAWVGSELVLTHDYSADGREILIQFPGGTIGDTVGWFPYAVKFQERHRCRLTCAMAERLIPLFAGAYPEIAFVTPEAVDTEGYYATYSMGLFFDDRECIHQPCDFRLVGLHRTAGYILGVDPTETPPRLAIDDDTRPIREPYVCIATQATTQAKYWNNPDGWREIVGFLKQAGYRVICIDQKPVHGSGIVWNHIPHGAEDETGASLMECTRWLRHAEFFVGLSSGLSWLAWAAGTPVVMISGFSHPTTEFTTPYRVINYHTCNSCWNDPHHRFDHFDFLWCPRHANTPRQFECTRLITAAQVIATLRTIPGFAAARGARLEEIKPVTAGKQAGYTGFYINLDRSPHRRAEIEAQLQHFGVAEIYERFPAADGNVLDIPNPRLKSGEIGVFISNYLLLKENLDQPHHLHVIEDDVIFSNYTEPAIRWVIDEGLFSHYDVICTDVGFPIHTDSYQYYKRLYDKKVTHEGSGAISDVKFDVIDLKNTAHAAATASYLINNGSIRKLFGLYEKELRKGPRVPIDILIRDKANEGAINVGCIFPFVTSVRLEHVLETTIGERYEMLPVLAWVIARQSFFVGCDWARCRETIAKFLPLPQDDAHWQILTSVLGFAVTDQYRSF